MGKTEEKKKEKKVEDSGEVSQKKDQSVQASSAGDWLH